MATRGVDGEPSELDQVVCIIRRELARVQSENRQLAHAIRQQNTTIRRMQQQLDTLRKELCNHMSERLSRGADELEAFAEAIGAPFDTQPRAEDLEEDSQVVGSSGVVLPAPPTLDTQ